MNMQIVRAVGSRGVEAWGVQVRADNRWGFSVHPLVGPECPGGFNFALRWRTVPLSRVPAEIREKLVQFCTRLERGYAARKAWLKDLEKTFGT